MLVDRLPFEPRERTEAWTSRVLGGNYNVMVHLLHNKRLGSLPSGPADFSPTNITVKELRAGIYLLALVSPVPNETPEEVIGGHDCRSVREVY